MLLEIDWFTMLAFVQVFGVYFQVMKRLDIYKLYLSRLQAYRQATERHGVADGQGHIEGSSQLHLLPKACDGVTAGRTDNNPATAIPSRFGIAIHGSQAAHQDFKD